MDNQPICDERILEAIEACRPGSDDVADPAMADLAAELAADPKLQDLYERLQRVDAMLAAAFRDTQVPEGLDRRLLDRLAAARAEQVVSAETAVVARPRRGSRRWVLAAGGTLAVAAGLLIAAWIGANSLLVAYSEEEAQSAALTLFREQSAEPGNLVARQPPPSDWPFSHEVARVRGMRWRSISGFLNRDGVAYDLPGRGGARATLYVVRRTIPGLQGAPPLRPSRQTAGFSTSAWQEGKLLYVLVVRGDRRTYQGLLDIARGPLT